MMRSKQEMLELILSTAREDKRIRAVILNGSRANPNTVRDGFQDYDIVYVVTEIKSFIGNPSWIDRFGERMILQMPELMEDPEPENDGAFVYLMQFTDGNRIDLTLLPVGQARKACDDSLKILLLDKDNRFTPFPPPDESSYFPTPPTEKAFADCCNEFWWVSPYVAKGLWRGENYYAHHLLETVLRLQLMKMLTWLFGVKTNFKRNPGKGGKHFHQVLSESVIAMLDKTYPDIKSEHISTALMHMGELFQKCAKEIAATYHFEYPEQDSARVQAYIRKIQNTPK